MCGISAFIGKYAFRKILDGLKQLQNRGYDSAGISVLIDEVISTYKYASDDHKNALIELEKRLNEGVEESKAYVGIGHTRWATHGPKTDLNAHPHVSNNGRFSLVHNGIIENYAELKANLIKDGFIFHSETDTEVIVNLIEYHYRTEKDVERAIEKTVNCMEGTWGIAVMYDGEPNKLYCTRHGSPILIGKNEESVMIVSEQSGFCNQYGEYLVLNNHDICTVTHHDSGYIQIKTNEVYIPTKMKGQAMDLTPDPYPHWTLKEIHEQVESCQRAVSYGGRILEDGTIRMGGLEEKRDELIQIDHLILLGCGTSYHAGMYAMKTFKELCHFDTVQLFDGADFEERDIPKLGKSAMILISQSGETKDLHRCVQIGKQNNIIQIGVINVVDSLIAREVDCGCYLNAGREVAVASTKAYTSQVIVLTMMAMWFAQKKGISSKKYAQYLKDIKRLDKDVEKTIQWTKEKIKEILPLFKGKNHCFLLGKGRGESVAREGALKIKEISYCHAEGYATSSLKHGPFALLETGFPVVLIAPDDKYVSKAMNAYEEVQSRYAKLIVVTDSERIEKEKDNVLKVAYNRSFREMLCVVPLQILSYCMSVAKGLNPDMPRNLAKVVTVE